MGHIFESLFETILYFEHIYFCKLPRTKVTAGTAYKRVDAGRPALLGQVRRVGVVVGDGQRQPLYLAVKKVDALCRDAPLQLLLGPRKSRQACLRAPHNLLRPNGNKHRRTGDASSDTEIRFWRHARQRLSPLARLAVAMASKYPASRM